MISVVLLLDNLLGCVLHEVARSAGGGDLADHLNGDLLVDLVGLRAVTVGISADCILRRGLE